jgi:hypothetical protein
MIHITLDLTPHLIPIVILGASLIIIAIQKSHDE